MKRVAVLSIILLAFCVAAFAGGSKESGAPAQGKVEKVVLKAGLIDPPGHIDVIAAQKMADYVKDKTQGQVEIQIYPASQLGFAGDLLQGLKVGTVEMFVGATTWLGAFETDYWLSGVLYVFNNQEHARDLQKSKYFVDLMEKLRTKHGIRVLSQDWDRGARNFISTKPIRTPQDLKDLKIRVPEQKSWINNFELAGAKPTPLALAETFTGLQQGIVDATEQASNWLYFNKYHTIAKNLVLSNHNFEETGVFISEKVFAKLTSDQKKIVQEAPGSISAWHNEELIKTIIEAEKNMRAEGINVIEVDRAAWKKHFRSIFPELVKRVGYSKELTDYVISTWD